LTGVRREANALSGKPVKRWSLVIGLTGAAEIGITAVINVMLSASNTQKLTAPAEPQAAANSPVRAYAYLPTLARSVGRHAAVSARICCLDPDDSAVAS